MGSTRPASLLLLLLPVALCDIGSSVTYQLHSYNDLREWPAILRKGVRSLKIDPQYAGQIECALQPRANGSDTRGCLLLNHDAIIPFGDAYFILNDVLSFLSNASYTPYFNRSDSPFAFALCFKGCGSSSCPCDNSTGFHAWGSLVDDFVSTALTLTSNLNVHWVLDGDASPHTPCLYDRWRPLVSTYISQSDPDAAFLSNNATLGYDRYQVLNEPTDLWASAVQGNYGKFVNATYPYQAWEPGDQPTILNVTDAYIQRGLTHAPGLNVATNADVAQFETYAGSRTGRAWDHLLTTVELKVQSSAVGAFATPGCGATCVYTLQAYSNGSTVLLQHAVASVGAVPVYLQSWMLPLLGAPLAMQSLPWADGTVTAWVTTLTAPKRVSVNAYNITSNAANLWFQHAVTLATVAGVTSASVFGVPAAASLADVYVYVAVTAQNASTQRQCRVVGSLFRTDGAAVASPACVGTLTQSSPTRIVNISAACVGVSATSASCAVVASDDAYVIRGLGATLDLSTGAVVRVGSTVEAAGDTLLPTHVGSDAHVALIVDDTQQVRVLEVHGNGYCPNNEPQNKVAIIKLCDQAPHVDAGAQYLNYNMGTFDAWTQQLAAGTGASACSADVLHGMYGMGRSPRAFFVNSNVSATAAGPAFGIVSTAFDGAGGDPNNCGIAVAINGSALQLHGWMFPVFV